MRAERKEAEERRMKQKKRIREYIYIYIGTFCKTSLMSISSSG
tara:strand:+ start:218 stop:346 length:129 start_codon:yes stop_codon:yes gene_type:complete